MPKAKYRILRATIEGFRGFTSAQTVEINGRNLFVFGPNGHGKSSIVEAIRWCLFGAPPGGDIEVRNTFYTSQLCRVSLVLGGTEGTIKVYRRLTKQLYYDLVRVHHDPERTGTLELRVASTDLPGHTFPANVLNGQAYKALHLVPYFVFSRVQSAIMELDLLIIDDPSQSFDTSHVELLTQELAEAAKHAQLIVASHEREQFAAHLGEYFDAEPYAVVGVNNFDRKSGRRLEYS